MDALERRSLSERKIRRQKEAVEQARLHEKSLIQARCGFLESMRCTVCLDVFSAPVHLSCGHVFCGNCLANWSERRGSCPSCRGHIGRVQPDLNLQRILDTLCPILLESSDMRDWESRNANWAEKKKDIISMWDSMGYQMSDNATSDSEESPNETSSGIMGVEPGSNGRSRSFRYGDEVSTDNRYGSRRERSRSPTPRRHGSLSSDFMNRRSQVSIMGFFSRLGGHHFEGFLNGLRGINIQRQFPPLSFQRVDTSEQRDIHMSGDEYYGGTERSESLEDPLYVDACTNTPGVIDLLSDHDGDDLQSSGGPEVDGRVIHKFPVNETSEPSLSEALSESGQTNPADRSEGSHSFDGSASLHQSPWTELEESSDENEM